MRDGCTCSTGPDPGAAAAEWSDPHAAHLHGWASLLAWFYQRAGMKLPHLDEIKAEAVPQPYRSILVHSEDMTPTLAAYFGQLPGLRVLSREIGDDSYRREVLLTLGNEPRPILYGVIRILLEQLPNKARTQVLSECHPLGRILETEAIAHLSWPQTFFRVKPDGRMAALLELQQRPELYGRRNVLLSGSRRLLAEVIEVLGPVTESASERNVE